MTSFHMAMQILLTILVTGGCTLLLVNFVDVAKEHVSMKKWFIISVKTSFIIHGIALPAAIINLIWSF